MRTEVKRMAEEKKVITITREFGSLGRPIARQVAERLGFDYYDRDMIETVAESLGEEVKDLLEYSEENLASPYRKMMKPLGYGAAAKQKKLFEIEKKVILDYANSRNCVIVGRCADYVLRSAGKKKLFNVLIYAPYSARYNFCVDRLGLTPEATADYMDKINKARADFYKKQTGERFDSPKYRHMMIDSSCMKMSDIIDVICSSAEKSFLS